MENVVDKYLDWKKIETFMLFLKNSANWLCLINDDFNKSCSVHWFLIGAKNEINQLLWEEKINVFLNFPDECINYIENRNNNDNETA